jgi:serine/threonine protein kinase
MFGQEKTPHLEQHTNPWNGLGRVKLGIHRVTGEQVAVKIINKAYLSANPAIDKAVKREIAIMKLIHHPSIMALHDVVEDDESPELYVCCPIYFHSDHTFVYLPCTTLPQNV